MVKVKVNNVEVEVPQEAYIIDAVEKAGFKVPLLCYLQGLFNEATCRICVVKANGRVVPACRFPVQEGMNIVTSDDELEKMRKINFELLLATHNIHCWDCYRKSTCTLSTLSRELGVEGIPVCSECPLYGEECLVKQGIPCLVHSASQPATVRGPRQNAPCIGCRGFTSSIDVWRNAIKYYRDNGISREHLESALSIFWVVIPVKLREIINEVYKQ